MIQDNVSLKPYNTFGVDVQTRFFSEAHTVADLASILEWYKAQSELPLLILGGGSNVLFTQDWPGLALKLSLSGKSVLEDTEDRCLIEAAAGEPWHEFVVWTLENGFNGLENLSLIPGNVGASPMQNIGAYGVEIKDVFESLTALNINTGETRVFNAEDCVFGYRDSIFKQAEKGRWIIVSVVFKLTRKASVSIAYGTIQKVLTAHKITNPTSKQVGQAVTAIRQSKLPDPKILGSAGSFFKNPVIAKKKLETLLAVYPAMPHYEVGEEHFKVPAGWLIEQAGWKGKTFGNYGVYKDQALVLVNYGGASGIEIWNLAQRIQASVMELFSIKLASEVNVI